MGTKELNMHSQSSVCPDDRDSLPPITEKDGLRMNLKANVQVNNYKNYNFDMNAFSNNPTPGMLLIGECTYVNRRTQLAFETAYPANGTRPLLHRFRAPRSRNSISWETEPRI